MRIEAYTQVQQLYSTKSQLCRSIADIQRWKRHSVSKTGSE